jgi:tRNA-Thr(GGU) m(6)t(6)A37 methyltransferase TsaA
METEYRIKSIGVIHSPFKSGKDVPIQPRFSEDKGEVELFGEYSKGLKDIEGFSHIILVYLFHKTRDYSLLVKPYLDDELKGVFATRFPERPNHIGISIVKLMEKKKNTLVVGGIDVIDGTPLLDIKPYVPPFDNTRGVKIGWLEGKL